MENTFLSALASALLQGHQVLQDFPEGICHLHSVELCVLQCPPAPGDGSERSVGFVFTKKLWVCW